MTSLRSELSFVPTFVFLFLCFPGLERPQSDMINQREAGTGGGAHGPPGPEALAPLLRLAQHTGSRFQVQVLSPAARPPLMKALAEFLSKRGRRPINANCHLWQPWQSFPTPSYHWETLHAPQGGQSPPPLPFLLVRLVCRCDEQLWRKWDSRWIDGMRLMRSSYQS